jgi:hypothetical protein
LNQPPLELRQRREDREDQLPRCGGRVDHPITERAKAHAAFSEILDECDEMRHRASQPIQAPDHQHIAGAQARQTGLQPWALGPAAGGGIDKDPLGAAPLLP